MKFSRCAQIHMQFRIDTFFSHCHRMCSCHSPPPRPPLASQCRTCCGTRAWSGAKRAPSMAEHAPSETEQQSQCAPMLGHSAATDAANQYGSIRWERPHWFAESWTGRGHILRMWSWLASCWVDPRDPTRKLDFHKAQMDEVSQHGRIRWYSLPRGDGSHLCVRTWDWDRDCWVVSNDETDNGSCDSTGLDRSWKWHTVPVASG